MVNGRANARPLLWSVLLHAGLLLGLALMAMPCNRFEQLFAAVGLPAWLNPVQCTRQVALAGPIIQATLVGRAAAPAKPPRSAPAPRKPEKAKPKAAPEKPPVKTLPPPPKEPAVRDQDKVVALSSDAKAEKALQAQRERERQRQSELEVDKLFAKLDKLKAQTSEAERKNKIEQQRLQQLADLKAQTSEPVPEAPAARTGGGGQEDSLLGAYQAALTQAITQAWLRPDNIARDVTCPIRITQIPGGQVIQVRVMPSCPFDEAGRRSVENAVLRAQPLPYNGFQDVFRRDLILNFKVLE